MPFFCPILPNTPIDRDRRPGRLGPLLRRRADRQPADRAQDETRSTAATGPPTSTRSSRRSSTAGGLPARRRAGPDRPLQVQPPRDGVPGPGREVRHQPARRPVLRQPHAHTWFVAFNHDRPAFKGPGQIPLEKAINYAHRPARARPHVRLPRQGSAPTSCCPPRSPAPRASIRSAEPTRHREEVARAGEAPAGHARPLRGQQLIRSSPMAQVLVFNLKQIGIDLEVKYFDNERSARRRPAGSPSTSPWTAGLPTTPMRPASSSLILDRGIGSGVNLDDPVVNRRIAAANRLSGEARRKAWADLDVDLMRNNPPWAPFAHLQIPTFVSRSLGCFVDHPVYGVRHRRRLQEAMSRQALTLARDARRGARVARGVGPRAPDAAARARPGRRGRAARCA